VRARDAVCKCLGAVLTDHPPTAHGSLCAMQHAALERETHRVRVTAQKHRNLRSGQPSDHDDTAWSARDVGNSQLGV
jgi:hypothetical protein